MSDTATARISDVEVRKVAALARLALTDDEVQTMGQQLAGILDYIAQLDELDTSDVPPTTHVLPAEACLRQDVVGEPLDRERILSSAPKADQGYFVVPKVV